MNFNESINKEKSQKYFCFLNGWVSDESISSLTRPVTTSSLDSWFSPSAHLQLFNKN